MTQTLLRGRLLTFHREPKNGEDNDALTYLEDGAVLIKNGIIERYGPFSDLTGSATNAHLIDHRPHLIMPGFIDTHIHFPQVQVIASWGSQLLDWLNSYTFPEETHYADPAHCAAMAKAFFDQLITHGTTTAVAFCSVHKSSADAFFSEAVKRNMRMLGGKVLMDRNAPDALQDTPQTGYDDTKALISQWHGMGRSRYVISPRFAITSSTAQMDTVKALAAEHPDCHIQTHLSENLGEIALAAKLYPDHRDYLDVYESFGLLRQNTLLGHAIHLQARDLTGSTRNFLELI